MEFEIILFFSGEIIKSPHNQSFILFTKSERKAGSIASLSISLSMMRTLFIYYELSTTHSSRKRRSK